jgi:Fur family ferric uptake transcriptional regulator
MGRRRRAVGEGSGSSETAAGTVVVEEAIRVLQRPPDSDEARLRRGLDQFRAFLATRGLNGSAVRDLVALAALSQAGHFEAHDLVGSLRQAKVESAYEASIYRTLPLLVDAGLIRPVMISARQRQLYERAFERQIHDHLVCTECGSIVEFVLDTAAQERGVAERYDFELTGRSLELEGKCGVCRRK